MQSNNGKSFEYACLTAFYQRLSTIQPVTIQKTSSYEKAKCAFEYIAIEKQNSMLKAASAAVNMLFRLEPFLVNPDYDSPLHLCIQEDAKGISGDVRDILMIRSSKFWEIGLSVKHNHTAVKHSRLSDNIDFGTKWFGFPCSQKYFNEIAPVFEELRALKQSQIKWSLIPDKDTKYYVPILQAFMKELQRLDQAHPKEIPKRLMIYLLGTHDFYKIISDNKRRMTQIQAISLHGNLNKVSGHVKPQIRLPLLHLPTCFYNINFKINSTTTVLVACNQGWQISFRIHNASTYVEPSLKFDVKLEGHPPNLYSHFEAWG